MTHTWRVFVEWEEPAPEGMYPGEPPMLSYAEVHHGFRSESDAERYREQALHERPGCNSYVEYWWAGKTDDDEPQGSRTEPARKPKPSRDEWSDKAMRSVLDRARAGR